MSAVEQAGLKVGMNLMEDKDDKCCDLTMKQRWIGSFICSGIATLFAIIAMIALFTDAENKVKFAILYTLSVVAAVTASFFVAGPKKHWTRLKDSPAHLISAIVLVLAIILIFVVACALPDAGNIPAVLILIVEIVALIFFYLTLYQPIWMAFKACISRVLPCG
jgi:hypothetical protein